MIKKLLFILLFILSICNQVNADFLNTSEYSKYKLMDKCDYDKFDCSIYALELLESLENKSNDEKYKNYLYGYVKYQISSTLIQSKNPEVLKKGISIAEEIINDQNLKKINEIEINKSYVNLGWTFYTNKFLLDNDKAFTYLKLAADAKHPYGLNNLGVVYEEGRIVKQDLNKAFSLYKESAALGHYWSHENVADFYILGRGGAEKSYDKAIRHFKLSKISKNSNYDFSLLKLLFKYQRLPKNNKEYLFWQEKLLIDSKDTELFLGLAWTANYGYENKKIPKKVFIEEYKWFYLCNKLSQIEEQIVRCDQEMNILKVTKLSKNDIKFAINEANSWLEKNWK